MIFVSPYHDPFLNLALENALLKELSEPALFLYQNDRCVIMGRGQNPWLETDVDFLQQNHIPLLRRQSGGGTVVHDLGNLNFCFVSPKAKFDKTQNLCLIQQALHNLGLILEIGESHDLLFQGKKVSGSAFRETKDNCFHHGTLLIQSDLDFLRRCLQVPPHNITSKSVRSRRSSVTNLNTGLEKVKQMLTHTFAKSHDLAATPLSPIETGIEETLALYRSDEWIYGRWL